MTSRSATLWWLIAGIALLIVIVVFGFVGFRSGTFAVFGRKPLQTVDQPTDQNPQQVQQYIPPSGTGGTCWQFYSYSNQPFVPADLASCKQNQYWLGWVPEGRAFMSSFGEYNPSPRNYNWDDSDGICLLTDPEADPIPNNLYECITQYKSEPQRWQSHFNGGEFANPDLGDAALETTTFSGLQLSADGYCEFIDASQAGSSQGSKAYCQDLYERYRDDSDPQTSVTQWCNIQRTKCQFPPFF